MNLHIIMDLTPRCVRHEKVTHKIEQKFSARRTPRKGYAQNRAKAFRGTTATKRLRTKSNKTFPRCVRHEKVTHKIEQKFSARRTPRKGWAQKRARAFRGASATKRMSTKTSLIFPRCARHEKVTHKIEQNFSAGRPPRKGYAQNRTKPFRGASATKRLGTKMSKSFPRDDRHEKVGHKNEQKFSAVRPPRKGYAQNRTKPFRGAAATKRMSTKTSLIFPRCARHGKVGRKNELDLSAVRPPRKGYAQNRTKPFRGAPATKRLRTKSN